MTMAAVVAVEVAAATTPAPPRRQAERASMVAQRVVLELAVIVDLLAVAERREQVEQPRQAVPPAVLMPEAVLPTLAAVVRWGRPPLADAQLPKV